MIWPQHSLRIRFPFPRSCPKRRALGDFLHSLPPRGATLGQAEDKSRGEKETCEDAGARGCAGEGAEEGGRGESSKQARQDRSREDGKDSRSKGTGDKSCRCKGASRRCRGRGQAGRQAAVG